mmetsp:Transcript_7968/g.17549  ORF Transcript_7968/g.17549 Transcript_7968/m.17549 type:complete len:438 (-) Transcript_7968:184-1497(-)
MYGGDEVSALVLDIGSTATKAGYAGEDCPKFVVPSSVGVVGGESGSSVDSASGMSAEMHVGTSALSVRRDGMRVVSPLSDGIIADWDVAEALVEHTYKHCLRCDASEHPLLMAESTFNAPAAREKTTELLFEKFNVPALFLSKNATLAAFAAGRGTALVLEMGGGSACAAAVHDGYVLHKPLKRSPFCGEWMDKLMRASLTMREPPTALHPLYTLNRSAAGPAEETLTVNEYPGTHPSYHQYMQMQLVREAREASCRVAPSAPSDASPLDATPWEHELPDHSLVDLGYERYHLPELLFTPALLKTRPPPSLAPFPAKAAEFGALVPETALGLPELVAECIRACDTDLRRELWGSIVVAGGGSLVPGLTDRLHARLNELVPQMSMKVKLLAASSPAERRFAVWIGGSILASLGSFQQLWMSKQEYDEQGAAAIHRKCP